MSETLRLFVALDIPAPVKEELGRLRRELEPGIPSVRWVRLPGIHLTLKFLGDVPADRVDGLRLPLAGCAEGIGPLRLETVGVGVFPHTRAPRILWVGFGELPEPVLRLQQRVELAMEEMGFPRERRDFRPHLTVGRFRRPLRRPERDQLAAELTRCEGRRFGGFTVTRLSLYSSTLLRSGARYQEVDGWPLGASGGPEEVSDRCCCE